MMAVSLRDGKQLWSQPLRFLDRVMMLGDLRVGDLDGDKRPEVVAFEGSGENGKNELGVRVFDGRDGKVRWAWTSGFVPNETPAGQSIVLANLDGNGKRQVCVSFVTRRLFGMSRRVVVLDDSGKERKRREMAEAVRSGLEAFDCNGDGRDELLVLDGDLPEGRLCAWDRELKDLWAWPARSIKAKRAVFDMDEVQMQIGCAQDD